MGEQTRYQLTYKGSGTVSIQGMLSSQAAGPDHIQTQLRSQLEIVQMTRTLLSVRLIAPDHSMLVNGQTQDLKSTMATLEHPCFVTVDATGRVQSVSFSSGTPVIARSLMRSLLSGLEFAKSNAAAHTWQSVQDTINGPAQVGYRSVTANTIDKQIVDYPHQREIGPKGMPQMHPVTKGALRFTFQQGQLEQVSGTYSTQYTVANKTMSNGQEQFQLTRLGAKMVPAAALRQMLADCKAQSSIEAPTALHVHDTDAAAERASWVTLLKGATPASLAADLAAADAKGVSNDAGLYSRLCAAMTLHPETCAGFERMLASAQPNKLSTRLVVAALAGVAGGSQERPQPLTPAMQAAERALCGVIASHKNQADMVILAAPALGMSGAPSLESERLLESCAGSKDRDIASSSALALGTMAHNSSGSIAKRAVQFLAHKLATANASFQQQLLGALGNAGSAECLNPIAPFAKSSSPQLRAVAMMSLRLVPGSRATDLLYRGLHDPDPDVRLNAARSFQFRPFSPEDVQACKRLISAEKMDRVRQALLENLKLEMPNYPQARTLLAQASKNDASADLRKTVASWLQ